MLAYRRVYYSLNAFGKGNEEEKRSRSESGMSIKAREFEIERQAAKGVMNARKR